MAVRKPLVSIGGKIRQLPAADEIAGTPADFTIIYPNGGSAASPANISANMRYVADNPFPGCDVICEVQIKSGSEWYSPGWYTTYSGRAYSSGTKAGQQGSGNIVITTGVDHVMAAGNVSGAGLAGTATLASAPCRVKVWKVKAGV
jgi:hypothetical protein